MCALTRMRLLHKLALNIVSCMTPAQFATSVSLFCAQVLCKQAPACETLTYDNAPTHTPQAHSKNNAILSLTVHQVH